VAVVAAALGALGDTSYAVYLTNDPVDGASNQTDNNQRAILTSIGKGPNNARSIVKATVNLKLSTLPPLPGSVSMVGESSKTHPSAAE